MKPVLDGSFLAGKDQRSSLNMTVTWGRNAESEVSEKRIKKGKGKGDDPP
jgi:hypothetical protein